jgi:hypothetical protein
MRFAAQDARLARFRLFFNPRVIDWFSPTPACFFMIARNRGRFFLGACFLMLGCALCSTSTLAQEGEDAGKLLDMAAQAEPKEALKHLNRVVKILGTDKTLARAERTELIGRLAKVMSEKTRLPEDIQTVIGPQANKQVTRQIYYRRYLEHWMFDAPLGLWVTLDCAKGQDPVIRAIRPLPADGF